jgi:hypothetical protein
MKEYSSGLSNILKNLREDAARIPVWPMNIYITGYEVFMKASVEATAVWDVTLCGLADCYQRIG